MIGAVSTTSFLARRSSRPIAIAPFVLALLSCTSGVTDSARVSTIEVEPEAVVVAVGAVAPLTAVLKDANGNSVNVPVAWSSSDTSIARVSNAGVVTARQVGDVRIAATAQGISATAEVGVSPKTVSSVRIDPSEASVRVGGTTTLEAQALDALGEQLPGRSISWSSQAPRPVLRSCLSILGKSSAKWVTSPIA